uniref:Uncharacterized protein n=1 Tax=Anguilla anguilla TaxID=7936 RepID=A0A0E9X2W6_ANGAN
MTYSIKKRHIDFHQIFTQCSILYCVLHMHTRVHVLSILPYVTMGRNAEYLI